MMNKFSYSLELYKRNIFSLEELDKYKESIKIANEVESYFLERNNNIDLIRNNIILSYNFIRELNLEERINYVKGIIFSRQFMNEKDVLELNNTFSNAIPGDEILEKSLFSVRNFSDDFDYEYYYNYLRNVKYDEKLDKLRDENFIKSLIQQSREKFNKNMEELDKDSKKVIVDEIEEDNDEEDDFDINKDSYVVDELSIPDRIKFSKEYFPVYLDGILNAKNIKEGTTEYIFLSKGMVDYFSYIIYQYEETYNFLYKDFLRNSKNLTLNI